VNHRGLTRSAAQKFYAELQKGEVVQVVSTDPPEENASEDDPGGEDAPRQGPVGPSRLLQARAVTVAAPAVIEVEPRRPPGARCEGMMNP
jgi:hypothetical protein